MNQKLECKILCIGKQWCESFVLWDLRIAPAIVVLSSFCLTLIFTSSLYEFLINVISWYELCYEKHGKACELSMTLARDENHPVGNLVQMQGHDGKMRRQNMGQIVLGHL